MKLSSLEEYGLRCLLQLARTNMNQSLTIEEISQAEGITPPNVAKIMRIMRRGGFVESVRGQNGGYTLALTAQEIIIGDVLEVLGGRLYDPNFCEHFVGSEDSCLHESSHCSIRSLWNRVQTAVDDVLRQTTLADLTHGPSQKETVYSPGMIAISDVT